MFRNRIVCMLGVMCAVAVGFAAGRVSAGLPTRNTHPSISVSYEPVPLGSRRFGEDHAIMVKHLGRPIIRIREKDGRIVGREYESVGALLLELDRNGDGRRDLLSLCIHRDGTEESPAVWYFDEDGDGWFESGMWGGDGWRLKQRDNGWVWEVDPSFRERQAGPEPE